MKKFQNIYIENEAIDYPLTKSLIEKHPESSVVWINNYKDVFNRKNQDYCLQKKHQNLILAKKYKEFLHPGSGLCQDFDIKNFYWSSCVMNCVCNCEYCFLKGMYPSANLVIFVNLDDYFKNVGEQDKYICISYDTDLFPLEDEIGYINKWMEFARNNKNITLEVRTKCKNLDVWNYEPTDNVIFAFSLSPENIISEYEHSTSNLSARLENIQVAQSKGFVTRLCFDPIIYCKDWQNQYSKLIESTIQNIDISAVRDISIGSFRISQSYLKNMRNCDNKSKIVNFPFKNIDGTYQYPKDLQTKMEQYLYNKLSNYFNKQRIFLWK